MDERMTKIMSVKVKVEFWEKFKEACGTFTVSAVIKRLMEKFIAGEVGLD